MKAWNELTQIYLRLAGTERPDPLTEFTEFLGKERFRKVPL